MIRRPAFLAAAALAAGLASLAPAPPARAAVPAMPRTPAPSPDGSRIAFSWQGDLWIVPSEGGAARRITAHPGYDFAPVWFPDGKRIAFASDRGGSDDVWLVDLAGGEPHRLTWHEAADVPRGVLGDDVLFTSRRHEAWDRKPALYRVPAAGGTERLAAKVLALEAAPSPDGERLLLVRGGTPADRRHYRGAANRELWILTLSSGALERLTTTAWDEDGPGWAGDGAIVFRSDGGDADRNLFRMDLATKAVTPLTRHRGSDVRNPRVSADGKLVAYELWDALWVVPTDGSAPPRKLELDVPADALQPATERATLKADADEVAVSPDGTQVALVVKGDVFVVARRAKELAGVSEPPTVRVTATPGREKDLAWSPDGRTLAYSSERSGNWDVWAASADGGTEAKLCKALRVKETRLTSSPEDEHGPLFSPDGKSLLYRKGPGGLVVAAADGSKPRVLFEHWGETQAAWSPDGRWLAFSREDQWHNPEVFLVPAVGGTPVNVSQHPSDDVHPVFSPDGRWLYWLSKRHGGTLGVWRAAISRADHERTLEEWVQLYEEEKGKKAKKADETADGSSDRTADRDREQAGKAKPVVLPITVDLDLIHERARLLKGLPGEVSEVAVAPDGQTIALVGELEGEKELYAVRWDGKELKRLTTGDVKPGQVAFSRDGKTLFYRSGKGTVGSVTVADAKAGDPVPFTARFDADSRAVRSEVFDEAWRELDRGFYDPAFHSVDWKAVHDRYRPLALAASCRRDFDDVVNLMLGELNSSHMGFRPPVPPPPSRTQTGALGVELEPAEGGKGVRVTEVLPDTPAARTDVALAKGDVILAVGGRGDRPDDQCLRAARGDGGGANPAQGPDGGGSGEGPRRHAGQARRLAAGAVPAVGQGAARARREALGGQARLRPHPGDERPVARGVRAGPLRRGERQGGTPDRRPQQRRRLDDRLPDGHPEREAPRLDRPARGRPDDQGLPAGPAPPPRLDPPGSHALRRGELLERRDLLLGFSDARAGKADRPADVRGRDLHGRRAARRRLDGSPPGARLVRGRLGDEHGAQRRAAGLRGGAAAGRGSLGDLRLAAGQGGHGPPRRAAEGPGAAPVVRPEGG